MCTQCGNDKIKNIKKIYFDMDGVLADFSKGVRELCGLAPIDQADSTPEQDDALWRGVAKVEHFFDKLDPIPGSVEMFKKIYERYGDKCEILTGVPKPHRGILTAKEDKISWAHRLLCENLKVNIAFKEEKPKYCTGRDCILIDDLENNIRAWEDMGGTGVLFKSAEETLEYFF